MFLEDAYKQARQFLKHDRLTHLFKRPKRPWILLLGPHNSGKTTLLANSDLALASTTQQTFKSIKPTLTLDWWVGQNAVFIDTPENFDPVAWRSLLQRMTRARKPYPFNSILVVVDFVTLSDRTRSQQAAATLSQQLQVLSEFHKTLPLTLIITQCDRIVGFNEFFSDLSPEERRKRLGFSLLQKQPEMSAADRLEHEYNNLLKQINESLLWQMHHEQNINKRARIKDFPIQMEQFAAPLQQFVAQLPCNQRIQLCGVYFTSAIQGEQTQNLIATPLSHAFHLQPYNKSMLTTAHSTPLFIADLFANISDHSDFPVGQSWRQAWIRLAAIPCAAALIVGLTWFWHYGYQDNINALRIIQANIVQQQTATLPWLAQLNALHETASQLQQRSTHQFRWSGLNQANKLQRDANKAYEMALRITLQKYLLGLAELDVTTNLQQNQLALYDGLKFYLILTTPKRFNVDLVQQWYAEKWNALYPNNEKIRQQLQAHLHNLLKLPNVQWVTNLRLIQQAQDSLKQLPLADIAYLQLQGHYSNQPIPLIANANTIPGIDLSAATIPAFFSIDNFNAIYSTEIPAMASKVIQGDWVMGNTEERNISPEQQAQLISTMRAIYLNQYTSAWLAVIPRIKIAKAQNLADIKTSISMLTVPSSPFIKLLKSITGNIALHSQEIDTNITSNIEYQSLNSFVQQQGLYTTIQQALDGLSQYLAPVVSAADANKGSYNLAIERFNRNGTNDPITLLYGLADSSNAPFNNWLKAIADNTWQILLNNTKQYINTLWQTMVLPDYNIKINERFPIFKDSQQDIALADFTAFFGPRGTLDAFFNYYLKPLVDMQQQYWTWKNLNGKSIDIAQDTLNNFIRGSLIQRMFFTNVQISPQIKFTLTPLKLSNASAFTLNVEGQVLEFKTDKQNTMSMTWPGPTPNTVTLQFIGQQVGPGTTMTLTGPWAWLRLVAQSKVELSGNPKDFKVTFVSGLYAAQFNLAADNVMNPYLPNILTEFRCPASL